MTRDIIIFGKKIGIVNDRHQFVSKKTDANFFRIYNGFGISVSVLKQLKRMLVKEIVIIYRQGKVEQKLTATPNDFFERGIRHQYRDCDFHMVLPLNCFNQKSLNKYMGGSA